MLLAFWNEHLRDGEPTNAPPVLAFVQGRSGWRAAATWPPPGVEERVLHPAGGGLLSDRRTDGADEYAATPVVGAAGGQWDTLASGMGYPLDQGPDDLLSLTYTTPPLEAPMELAGSPEAVLEVERVEGDGPFDLVAKLVDVAPDGSAELITTGWARGTGGTTTIPLWATAWALAPGHRLRLSISCADFPRTWPDPTSPRLRIGRGASALRLPAVPDGIGEPVDPPRPTPVPPSERFPWTLGGSPSWTIEHDIAHDAVAVTLGGGETMALPEGGTLALRQRSTARVEAGHPEGASVDGEVTIEIAFPGGERVEVLSRSRAWRDRNLYNGRVTLDGRTLLDRSWRNF